MNSCHEFSISPHRETAICWSEHTRLGLWTYCPVLFVTGVVLASPYLIEYPSCATSSPYNLATVSHQDWSNDWWNTKESPFAPVSIGSNPDTDNNTVREVQPGEGAKNLTDPIETFYNWGSQINMPHVSWLQVISIIWLRRSNHRSLGIHCGPVVEGSDGHPILCHGIH